MNEHIEIEPTEAEIKIKIKGHNIPKQYMNMIDNIRNPKNNLYDIKLKNVIPYNISFNQDYEENTLSIEVKNIKLLEDVWR